ncbi:MAG: helix-turn-helix transcriptional regulator [Bacteroidetes bacterium]|nr:helix-turn-helix transcriptional regulator [Bacteroidota bacterium]
MPFAKGESFAERLKAYRKLHGLTQQQLADELGVAMLTVRTWEAGTHQPRPETRERVEGVIKRAFESMYEV